MNEPYQRVSEPNVGAWVGLGIGATSGFTGAQAVLHYGGKKFPTMPMSGGYKALINTGLTIGGAGIGSVIGQKLYK